MAHISEINVYRTPGQLINEDIATVPITKTNDVTDKTAHSNGPGKVRSTSKPNFG